MGFDPLYARCNDLLNEKADDLTHQATTAGLNNLLNILMIFRLVLFDDFDSMLLSSLDLSCI